MRYWALALLMISIFCFAVPGLAQKKILRLEDLQDFSEIEITILHNELRLPQSYPITLVKSKAAPPGDPLKIYIRTIHSDDVRKEFSKWVQKWDKKDASDYGALKVVLWDSQADLILVQYKFPLPDEAFNQGIQSGQILSSNPDPIYSYIILRKEAGMEIVWRNFAWSGRTNPPALSLKLESALKGLLKERAKVKSK